MSDEQETKREIVRSDVGAELTYWSGALVKRALPLADGILQRRSTTQAASHYRLGVALLENDNEDGAIQEYREAIRLDPAHADAHCHLGIALTYESEDAAIQEFREALRLNPAYALAHFGLAVALHVMKGERDEAIQEYREVLRLDLAATPLISIAQKMLRALGATP